MGHSGRLLPGGAGLPLGLAGHGAASVGWMVGAACIEMKSMDEVLERFRTIAIEEQFDLIVAIANGGVVPAGILNQRLQLDLRCLRINLRDASQKPLY